MNAPNANGPSVAGATDDNGGKRKWTPSTSDGLVDFECGDLHVKKQRSHVDTAMQRLGDTMHDFAQYQARNVAKRIDSQGSPSSGAHSSRLLGPVDAQWERKNADESITKSELGETEELGVRVILRAVGLPDLRLAALPENTVEYLTIAFRAANQLPADKALTLVFAGKALDPKKLMSDSCLYDVAVIEVRMNEELKSLELLPTPAGNDPTLTSSRGTAFQMGTQADPIALDDSPPAKRIRQIYAGPASRAMEEAPNICKTRILKVPTYYPQITVSKAQMQFYAVARGLLPGVYHFSEKQDVKICTSGWTGAKVRPFATQADAVAYVRERKIDDNAQFAAVKAFFGACSFTTTKDWMQHKQLYQWFSTHPKARVLPWALQIPAPSDTPYTLQQEEGGKATVAEMHHPMYNKTLQVAPRLSPVKDEPKYAEYTSSKYFDHSSAAHPSLAQKYKRSPTVTRREHVQPTLFKSPSATEEVKRFEPYADFPKDQPQTNQPNRPLVIQQASHVHAVSSIAAQLTTDAKIEPVLCSEQRKLVDLILQGRNVFYTGSAGCGKSTVLKAFVRELKDIGKNVRIVAPTGKAALEVNGTTYFTFAGWTPSHLKRPLKELVKGAHQKFVRKRMAEVDVLIIDEVSMLENHIFERLNEVMKEARGSLAAFGGVQIVVTGDFCQLPPVKPFQHCMTCGREMRHRQYDQTFTCPNHGTFSETDKWAFKSMAWRECNFTHVNLTTIYRQRDRAFIDILERCRLGRQLTEKEMQLLLNHECDVQNPTRLYSTRAEVARLNDAEFSKLKSKPHKFKCLDHAVILAHHPNLAFKGEKAPDGTIPALREGKFEPQVDIKDNMRVVLQVNLSIEQGLVNGAQGVVVDWEPYDKDKLPKAEKKEGRAAPRDKDAAAAMVFSQNTIHGEHAEYREVRLKDFVQAHGIKEWPIVEFDGGLRRTIYAECLVYEFGDEQPYSIMSRTQIPLIAGWAMTVHKSQGMTLNKVEVDLGKAFEEGQVYVALSRATSLQGLKVLSLGQRIGTGNAEVHEFLRTKLGVKI